MIYMHGTVYVSAGRDLKISNDESEMIMDCLHLNFLLGTEFPRMAVMKRFLAGPNAQPARLMLDALAKIDSSIGKPSDVAKRKVRGISSH